jgi:2-dehydro-3-deoxy-D-gluconate 5-dehydrogenase
MNLFDLAGKKALVTGGSRGIGRALAEALSEAGATVVINGVAERVFETARQIHAHTGQKVIPIQADLSQRDETKRLFYDSLEKLGGMDIIFVNHGIQRAHEASAFPADDWDLVLEVDLTSLFLLDQLAGQFMLSNGGGKIVNIASLISVIGGMRVPAYAAAKGGKASLYSWLRLRQIM